MTQTLVSLVHTLFLSLPLRFVSFRFFFVFPQIGHRYERREATTHAGLPSALASVSAWPRRAVGSVSPHSRAGHSVRSYVLLLTPSPFLAHRSALDHHHQQQLKDASHEACAAGSAKLDDGVLLLHWDQPSRPRSRGRLRRAGVQFAVPKHAQRSRDDH